MSQHRSRPAVASRVVPTPIGPLLLAATDIGLVRVAFEGEGFDAVLAEMGGAGTPGEQAARHLATAQRQIDEYLAGRRRSFDVDVDLSAVAGFRRRVLDHLPSIGYGTTSTYREVAGALGSPGASRAVGTACATNPLPIVIPCHRVIRTDGGWGGYLGGLEVKQWLSELERD